MVKSPPLKSLGFLFGGMMGRFGCEKVYCNEQI